jgi:hypothetical protein
MVKAKKQKYRFNSIQAKQLAKYFIDLSKITFSLLVIGVLVADRWIALKSGMWYIGFILTILFLIAGMFFYKERKNERA